LERFDIVVEAILLAFFICIYQLPMAQKEECDCTPITMDVDSHNQNDTDKVQTFTSTNNHDKMNEMLKRMQTLRSQLHRLTILSMTADPTSSECIVIANQQSAKMRQLQAATDAFIQLYGMQPATGATKDVPIELPYFQWKDHVFRKRTAIFASPNACLKHFENVLLSHIINLEANRKRLVLSKLSNSMST
jgi:hypothetical protein